MKKHFLHLLEYDHYANHLMLHSMKEAGYPSEASQLMAHILAAKKIWLTRCQEQPMKGLEVWPKTYDVTHFEDLNTTYCKSWNSFIESIDEEKLNHNISFRTSKGDVYRCSIKDIISHVVNHGTHHRAQIGQIVKQNGQTELPITDFIYYVR